MTISHVRNSNEKKSMSFDNFFSRSSQYLSSKLLLKIRENDLNFQACLSIELYKHNNAPCIY